MEFRTPVQIPPSPWRIDPFARIVTVGSCFADEIGRRLSDDKFRVTTNPYGVMYNPASIRHTVERMLSPQASEADRGMEKASPDEGQIDYALLTLGTNHIYRLRSTGEIVDNCEKRPARLFQEEELTADECTAHLEHALSLLKAHSPMVRVVLTVSPIRYAKYGFHGSQVSKATLLLAADAVCRKHPDRAVYFPAYEILNDELRDYRFYAADMLHPSAQAADYVYERFAETFFSPATRTFLDEWHPLRAALNHRPLHPESDAYATFKRQTEERRLRLAAKYPDFQP